MSLQKLTQTIGFGDIVRLLVLLVSLGVIYGHTHTTITRLEEERVSHALMLKELTSTINALRIDMAELKTEVRLTRSSLLRTK